MKPLIHYGKPMTRSFPTDVDIWLPPDAVILEAKKMRVATTITYIVPSGRKSRIG